MVGLKAVNIGLYRQNALLKRLDVSFLRASADLELIAKYVNMRLQEESSLNEFLTYPEGDKDDEAQFVTQASQTSLLFKRYIFTRLYLLTEIFQVLHLHVQIVTLISNVLVIWT